MHFSLLCLQWIRREKCFEDWRTSCQKESMHGNGTSVTSNQFEVRRQVSNNWIVEETRNVFHERMWQGMGTQFAWVTQETFDRERRGNHRLWSFDPERCSKCLTWRFKYCSQETCFVVVDSNANFWCIRTLWNQCYGCFRQHVWWCGWFESHEPDVIREKGMREVVWDQWFGKVVSDVPLVFKFWRPDRYILLLEGMIHCTGHNNRRYRCYCWCFCFTDQTSCLQNQRTIQTVLLSDVTFFINQWCTRWSSHDVGSSSHQ